MVITWASAKGGVGKTTNSLLLSCCLAKRGHKVLYVDLDLNCSGTTFFLPDFNFFEKFYNTHNAAYALTMHTVDDCIITTEIPNIDIIPSHPKISQLRSIGINELKTTFESSEKLANYDFIIIDTAPTYDNIVINALNVADYIFTPVEFTLFCLNMSYFFEYQIQNDLPQQKEKWIIVFSRWREQYMKFDNSMDSQIASQFNEHFKNILGVNIPYVQNASKNYCDERGKMKLSLKQSDGIGQKRLCEAFNEFANMLTGEEVMLEF